MGRKIINMIMVSIVLAFSSQIYIDLTVTDFRVAFAIVLFPVFMYVYRDLSPFATSVMAAIFVYLWRISIYSISHGNVEAVWFSYLIELSFYIGYGAIYQILMNFNKEYKIEPLFFIMIASDFFANMLEALLRVKLDLLTEYVDIIGMLLLFATVRSAIAWIIINVMKYYKILLKKEEHEKRYKRLMWFTSKIKTEIYWLEKSMNHIENVMGSAYGLFEDMSSSDTNEKWKNDALMIARDVHEIKKEFAIFIDSVKDITEVKLADNGMYLKTIFKMLKEATEKEAKKRDMDIEIEVKVEENIYIKKHYYMMSIFRNLMMNAVDAFETDEKDMERTLKLIHSREGNTEKFEVIDTAGGIPEDIIDIVFSAGFSTKINYETGSVNRGLGLSIVKELVEIKLGGKIDVFSKHGEGTTFLIEIPSIVEE